MAASPNWPELSRRAHNTLSSLSKHSPTYTQTLRSHIHADPANPFLWHALVKHLSSTQPPATVIPVVQDAIRQLPPGRRGGLFDAWGSLELRRGRLDSALAIFSRGIVADPYAPLFASLASLQLRSKLVDQARATYRKGTTLYPHHAFLWRAWASAEAKLGAVYLARDLWKVAIERDRRNPKAWYSLALTEKKCGANLTEVIKVLYDALSHCPMDPWLRLSLARLEESRAGPAVALRVLDPLEKRNDEVVLRAMARLEADQGNFERARALYRKAADVEAVGGFKRKNRDPPQTVKSLHAWALMEVKTANLPAARNILEEALAMNDTDSAVWRAIGELEVKDGNYERARNAFQNSVAIDPSDARVLLEWGKMEVLAGNLESAESLMKRVANANNVRTDSDTSKDGDDRAAGRSLPSADTETDSDRVTSSVGVDFEDDIPLGGPSKRLRNAQLTPHVLADALRERALLASRSGHSEDSLALLTRASEIEPDFPKGWRLLASQEMRLNGAESARKVYRTALSKAHIKEHPKLYHWWGQDEKASGNIPEARGLFRQATCANPDYMSAWLSWGMLEKSEGDLREACKIFEKASRRAEKDLLRAPFIFQAWGRVEELDRGRAEIAVMVFQRGVNLVPSSGALWSAWGMLEERRGNAQKARELFERATAEEPKLSSSWHSWALLESGRGNFKRAGELYRKGHEHDPTDAALLATWARLEGEKLGHPEQGRNLFEKAVSADPYYGPGWHSWGCLEMKCGSYERARELFLKAAKVQPRDPTPFHTIGVLEAEHCDNGEAAVRYWAKAVEAAPNQPFSYQSWALFEGGKRGDMMEARRLFNLGIERVKESPKDAALLLQSWAALEEQKGNNEEAQSLLQRSLSIDARRAETWHSLARIELSRGNRDEARRLVGAGVDAVTPGTNGSCLYVMWGTLEAEDGNIEKARALFAAGVRANPSVVRTWKAYANMERKYGSESRGAELMLTADALVMRKGQSDVEFS